jgi:hypothetical protein
LRDVPAERCGIGACELRLPNSTAAARGVDEDSLALEDLVGHSRVAAARTRERTNAGDIGFESGRFSVRSTMATEVDEDGGGIEKSKLSANPPY